MIRIIKHIILFVCLGIMLTNCSGTKHLQANEVLVKNTSVSFLNPKKINKKPQLKAELDLLAKPVPDYGLGGFNLWVYNQFKNLKKQKGFRHWIKKTFGRAPQFYEPLTVNRSKLVLEKYLKDNGYFGATISIDTVIRKQQMHIDYQVFSKGQYQFNRMYFPPDTTIIGKLINDNRNETLIDTTQYYSKAVLDAERTRLAKIAWRNGCIDFQENELFYVVDTFGTSLQADIHLELDTPSDTVSHQAYRIGETYVYPAYLLDDTTATKSLDTIKRRNLTIIQPISVVHPKVLRRAIPQRKGEWINRELQDIGLSHLLDLGLFKFVRLAYEKQNSGDSTLLDRYFYLTPALTQNVQYEFQVNNRAGGYFGSAVSVTYSHNNLFYGAERFDVKLSAGFETQFQANQNLINTIDLSFEANLLIPKLLVPSTFRKRSFRFVPRTRIGIGNNFERRTDFYTINSANLDFGYEWQQNTKIRHQLTALRVNQLDVGDKSASFQELLKSNIRLKNSFEDVFIVGSTYTFKYNSAPKSKASPYYYFQADIGTSGNVVSLFAKDKLTELGQDTTQLFLGRPYAQFLKFAPDFRAYFPRQNKNLFASHVAFGIGLPYGNSEELPYIEQFFVGGANSIRAFQIRELGPGSFVDESILLTDDNQFIDQTGDLKLEFSLEYRFKIIRYLNGAVFLDGGNVWLLNSDDRPEGVFKFNRFFKEIALGTGYGLRLDFDFFVIRFDTAFPIRKPIANGQFGWTIDDLAIFRRSWRQENLTYNLAIGYPF